MMNIIKSIIIIGLLFEGLLHAQSDKKAEQLLESVINKTASYDNLKAELSGWDFAQVKTEAENAWNKEINVFDLREYIHTQQEGGDTN